MKLKKFLYFGIVISMFASCAVPKDLVYFVDAPRDEKVAIDYNYKQKIQIDDLLGINVTSPVLGTNPEVFNKNGSGYGNNGIDRGYLVDQDGYIVFPYVGKLKAAGLTREELRDTIEFRLKKDQLLLEPTVSVNLLNFRFYTLGVLHGGSGMGIQSNNMMLQGERLTILQAIAMCGDMGLDGKRKTVTIVREQDGYREIGTIDLTSKDLFNSPYYYVAQNDLIYVEQSDRSLRQAAIDFTPLTVVSTVMGFATTILTLVYVILK